MRQTTGVQGVMPGLLDCICGCSYLLLVCVIYGEIRWQADQVSVLAQDTGTERVKRSRYDLHDT